MTTLFSLDRYLKFVGTHVNIIKHFSQGQFAENASLFHQVLGCQPTKVTLLTIKRVCLMFWTAMATKMVGFKTFSP